MSDKDKLHTGELYQPMDPEILEKQLTYLDSVTEYNAIPHVKLQEREAKLKTMFAEIGEGCYVESPLHSNMGCRHVHFGNNVYANFNLTLVDDTHIYVGDYTMFGPGVIVATASHPILPELRERVTQYNLPVHIGRNCWIGAGAIIMPGVTVGDNTVIGAGSLVTKDIPANVVAYGSPCRVVREISERDRECYYKDRKIDPKWFE